MAVEHLPHSLHIFLLPRLKRDLKGQFMSTMGVTPKVMTAPTSVEESFLECFQRL
jgi:hypothetical protein